MGEPITIDIPHKLGRAEARQRLANGIGQLTENGSTIRSAPLFEVGDPRYAWLNRIQAVGIGGRTGEALVVYEIYALL